jgi:5-methylcytosine-specific restriction enzyme A
VGGDPLRGLNDRRVARHKEKSESHREKGPGQDGARPGGQAMIYKVGPNGELVDPRRKRKDRRPSASKRGYGARWQRFRKRFLRDNPWCARCPNPATQVHHLDGLGPKGPLGFEPSNCEALCGPAIRV